MIIYWNRNIAGTHRGQNFMIKGQKFLQWYISGRNIISELVLPLSATLTESIITGTLSESVITGTLSESIVTGVLS